jgi:hypothetical protein
MIEQAWNEYRGWAKRARSLEANADRWNVCAMIALDWIVGVDAERHQGAKMVVVETTSEGRSYGPSGGSGIIVAG